MPDEDWPPYTPEPPKTRVYRFGAVWHWKCRGLQCGHGGREREWKTAVERAHGHAAEHSRTGDNRWT
jgi:hypothetical protein